MKLLARLFILAGILFFALGIYQTWLHLDENRLKEHSYTYTNQETAMIKRNNLPTKISLPDLSINLPVIPAKIVDNEWQTSKDGVSYLTTSPVPGEKGNSVLYAHNWASLFGKLPDIKPGNIVEVEYADKSKKKFAIAYTLTVSPGDESIIERSNDKRITLYTCTGLLDSKRLVAVAFLQDK